MADKLQAGLYPFVNKINIVDPIYYPEVTPTDLSTEEWCNFIILDTYNIYTIRKYTDEQGLKWISLVKLQRQDFHELYYVIVEAIDVNRNKIQIVTDLPDLKEVNASIQRDGENLYLIFNKLNGYNIYAYEIQSDLKSYDVKLLWNSEVINGENFLNHRGMIFNSMNVISWHILRNKIILTFFDKLTGIETGTETIPFVQELSYAQLRLINDESCYVIVRDSTSEQILMIRYNLLTFTLTNLVGVSTSKTFSNACDPGINIFKTGDCAVIYGFNYDTSNTIQLATVANTIGAPLQEPYYYNVNKLTLFNEQKSLNQNNMAVSVTYNRLNSDFFYVAYISNTSQIRLMKFYRHNTGQAYEPYLPLLMWATRLGSIDESFDGQMDITCDLLGNVHVFSRSLSGKISIWKIQEFILDLGHTENTIIADVDTIPKMLQTLTSNYTIFSTDNAIHLSQLPLINDVIIKSITNGPTAMIIEFQYIDYDYLQVFPDIVSEIKNLITLTFQTLYEDTNINVLNLSDTGNSSVDGSDTTLNIQIPTGTEKKPCVLKGTDIIVIINDKATLIPVENIKNGDIIISHTGKRVKVLEHLTSVIYAQSHNAPYLIPENFFGENRPYKNLFISGDHGILLNYKDSTNFKVIYAADIKTLQQMFKDTIVQYHHLLLENHHENFYIANGLEVDSFHPGPFMKNRV